MSWTPPPSGPDRPDGPTDQPPWAGQPIPRYTPGPSLPGQPEDSSPTPPPPPPPPTSPTLSYASWGQRVVAALIDWSLITAVATLVSLVVNWAGSSDDGAAGWAWLLGAAYLAWLNGSRGQSPGKALLGLKVVREHDGLVLGGPRGLLRGALLGVVSVVTLYLFFVVNALWPLGDAKNRTLHDQMAGAVVVSGHPSARPGFGLLRP